mmetsp:Transcript_13986/g.58873  ORF Transcript_13986/g.58873 Transcript_13986/m.58873 type:complete len:238 (+) Transcript_13986:671-1384(+)
MRRIPSRSRSSSTPSRAGAAWRMTRRKNRARGGGGVDTFFMPFRENAFHQQYQYYALFISTRVACTSLMSSLPGKSASTVSHPFLNETSAKVSRCVRFSGSHKIAMPSFRVALVTTSLTHRAATASYSTSAATTTSYLSFSRTQKSSGMASQSSESVVARVGSSGAFASALFLARRSMSPSTSHMHTRLAPARSAALPTMPRPAPISSTLLSRTKEGQCAMSRASATPAGHTTSPAP